VQLGLERRDAADVPVIAVHGDLDLDTAPRLRLALIEAMDERPGRRVVVDLEGVDFIDSAGLGMLVAGLRRARSRDGDLVLVATARSVVRMLAITGLTRLFEIHATLAAAVEAGG
jgi:anti-sigma B factor antagonist